MVDDGEFEFPGLDLAAKRLDLDAGELAESMLHRLDCGAEYWDAMHGVVAEAAQRRGLYDGEIKVSIDNGDVFAPSGRLQKLPQRDDGLASMLRNGEIDCLDALAVAGAWSAPRPASTAEAEFERRRAEQLERRGWQ